MLLRVCGIILLGESTLWRLVAYRFGRQRTDGISATKQNWFRSISFRALYRVGMCT